MSLGMQLRSMQWGNNNNVVIKQNDAKRIVVKCMVGCSFHLRFAKRVGNEYWQVVSFNDVHACPITPKNRQATPEWLARKLVHTTEVFSRY